MGEKMGRAIQPSQQATLDEDPGTDEAMALVLRAWRDLSTCRPMGMVAGLIPWTVMREWARVEKLDEEATELLVDALVWVDVDDFTRRNTKPPPPPHKPRGRS